MNLQAPLLCSGREPQSPSSSSQTTQHTGSSTSLNCLSEEPFMIQTENLETPVTPKSIIFNYPFQPYY